MAITIKDIARKTGVSSATVSRVLTNRPHVRDELRQRVFQAVKELRYQPSQVARSFRVRKTRIIGLIISDILNPFFTSLVRYVEDIASEKGYAVILCNTDEDAQKEKNYVEFMLSERVAGVVIAPAREENCSCDKLIDAGIPMVCVDRKLNDVQADSVLVDNISGTQQAVEHLIAMGHVRIGTLFGQYSTTGRQREVGYRNALQKHSIPLRDEYILRGMPKEEDGQLLTRQLLNLSQPPTAIFCGNNLLTTGALREIFSQGLIVPDEVAIAGFDDLEWYGLVEPSITAVWQPTQEIGKTAIDLLFRRIEGDRSPCHQIVLRTELHIRCSSEHAVSHYQ